MEKNIMKKISIVVPVYNVEKYINQCLESICKQTYKNLEIILVYDESADGSLERCQEWAEKDERILLIVNQSRNGLGAARNVGLKKATGEYVVYLDSDDWMDVGYVETLYHAIERTQADYVASVGYYEVGQEEHITKRILLPAGEYSGDIGKILILLGETPAVWKKIYNREWLMKHNLFQPELFHYEDWGFDIALVLQTDKIVLIPQIGVYYRYRREGSLSDEKMESLYLDFRRSIEFGLNKAEETGKLDQYRIPILKYLLQDYCMRKERALLERNDKALQIIKGIEEDILTRRLGYHDVAGYERLICFGSLSLRWMVERTAVFTQGFEYYGFSSMISAISCGKAMEVENQNEFRLNQVSQDIEGVLGMTLDSLTVKTLLFIDLLEERNSVLEAEEGQYITDSEAYIDSTVKDINVRNRIDSGTDSFVALWQEKCLSLVEKLRIKQGMIDVVLVRSRMALRYGDFAGTKEFVEVDALSQINTMISGLEDYFLEHCRRNDISVTVFDLPEEYSFTDEQFKYGCKPQYMNGALYNHVGFEIFKRYGKERLG